MNPAGMERILQQEILAEQSGLLLPDDKFFNKHLVVCDSPFQIEIGIGFGINSLANSITIRMSIPISRGHGQHKHVKKREVGAAGCQPRK